MSLRGVVPYPVNEKQSKLFSAQGLGTPPLTLYNVGPGIVWVSTHQNVSPSQGIPLNPAATIQWDGKNDCYAVTLSGQLATMLATDNSGALNDPSVIADAINATAITATGIAAAIAASGLTSAGIAAAIPTVGTPVLLQRIGITSAVGVFDWLPNVWVDGVGQGSWLVPAGKKLVVNETVLQMANSNAAIAPARLQLVDGAGGVVPNSVHDALAARVAASAVERLVSAPGPGAVTFPAAAQVTIREVSGVTGVIYDVSIHATLYP